MFGGVVEVVDVGEGCAERGRVDWVADLVLVDAA